MLSVGSLPDVASQILLYLAVRGLCSDIIKLWKNFVRLFTSTFSLGHCFNGVIM
jgi:hypothetical protein